MTGVRTVIRLALGTLLVAWWLVTATAPAAAAGWVLPLAGEAVVTRPFDPPATPYGPGHRGVDLAGAPGETVLAAGDGTIGYAAPLAGRGVVTVLHSGGLRTTYEPVSAAVRAGQAVVAGQPIGTLETGHAGCPVAACLHWGLLHGEVYLDPMSLLGLGPIRLLPSGDGPSASSSGPASSKPSTSDSGSGGSGGPGSATADEVAAEDPSGGANAAAVEVPAGVTAVAGLAIGAAVLLARPHPP